MIFSVAANLWNKLWFAPESPRNLVIARAIVALQALWILLSRPFLPDVVGWPEPFWKLVPTQMIARFGIRAFPVGVEWILFIALHLFLALAALGMLSRLSCIAAALLLYHFGPFEQGIMWTSFTSLGGLTLPLLALAILGFAETPRWTSERSWEWCWPLVMIQMLFSLQYALPGLVKLHVSGLRWFGPENIANETARMTALWDPKWAGLILANRWIAVAVGIFALAIELLFPLAVISRRARWVVIPLAFVGHFLRVRMWGLYFLGAPLLLLFVDWNAVLERLAASTAFIRKRDWLAAS